MVEKGTREDICYLVPIYARIKILYIKNYNKSKDPSYLAYLDKNSLHDWTMSQIFPVGER